MSVAIQIKVTQTTHSRLKDMQSGALPFGKLFTDHMLEATYENGAWQRVEIKPYQPLLIDPAMSALHYGQEIFEGIKAYQDPAGNACIFRPEENFKRFNRSAARLCMPVVPENIFMDGLKELIRVDKAWIPSQKDASLYIRPIMFGTECSLGVKPSSSYKFIIILSPSGAYHSEPMKIWVETEYTRAAPGGVGYSKNAGNYAGSLIAAENAQKQGYDQVLWTDPFEHKWLQEVGMMNVFFLIGDTAITPSLDEGTILPGITRDSLIVLLKEMGHKVEERRISIDELVEAYRNGTLKEIWGAGTAATVSPIQKLHYRDIVMDFDLSKAQLAPKLKVILEDIKFCRTPDRFNWMTRV